MAGRIEVGGQGAVQTIALLRVEGTDGFTDDPYLGIAAALESAQRNSAIRCIVVTGGFDVFAAGDHRAVGAALKEATSAHNVSRFLHSLANIAKPIIAAVEGAVTGVGTTLVFCCDQVIAASSATFASPLEAHDLVPDGAMNLLIPRRLAQHRAFAMLVPGRSMRAERAYDAGLIDMIVPSGQAAVEAARRAQQLCLPAAEDDHRGVASEGTAGRTG